MAILNDFPVLTGDNVIGVGTNPFLMCPADQMCALIEWVSQDMTVPSVHRTASGIRDYQPDDLGWIELAKCMRGAGLPVEAIIEYVKLTQEGEHTIPARLQLLTEQRELLLEQKEKIDTTLKRLNYKIERYEIAVETGKLTWD